MLMPGQISHRILRGNVSAQGGQALVLRQLKLQAFQAFQFNAYGVIVAALTPAPGGNTSMPGPVIAADKLPDFALAGDEKMAGHFQPANALVVRVSIPVELIAE